MTTDHFVTFAGRQYRARWFNGCGPQIYVHDGKRWRPMAWRPDILRAVIALARKETGR